MTTTLEDRLQIRLREIADRDGLSNMAEMDELREFLNDAATILDQAAADAAAVASAYGEEVPIPFQIKVEHVAALSLEVQVVRDACDELRGFTDQIERHLLVIEDARQAQAASDA